MRLSVFVCLFTGDTYFGRGILTLLADGGGTYLLVDWGGGGLPTFATAIEIGNLPWVKVDTPRRQETSSACYATGVMPLAFTQEYFFCQTLDFSILQERKVYGYMCLVFKDSHSSASVLTVQITGGSVPVPVIQ